MIIPNKNYSSKNSKSAKCGFMQCEKENFNISSLPQYAHDLSTIGLSAGSVQTENDCWYPLSKIEYEQKHSKILSCTAGLKNRDLKEQKLRRALRDELIIDGLKFDEFPQQNLYDLQDREYVYDISDAKLYENECHDEKQNREEYLNTIPEDIEISKNINKSHGVMIVNYHLTKNNKLQASNKKERPPHNFSNKKNTKTNSQPNEEFKSSKLHTQGKPEKNINDNESSTFSMMNDDSNTNSQKHFPDHLQTSYVPEEYKTNFNDFPESNPPFSSRDTSNQHNFGCSTRCIGMKMSMQNDITRTQNISMCYPHMSYMEPKCCSMSCQGIPCGKQRNRIPQPESKISPEIEIPNSCCYNNLKFHDSRGMNLNEECCRKELPQTNKFQDDILKLRHLECCRCNKSHIAENYNEKLNIQSNNPKKKKPFTCCKSGKVDQEELSINHKPQVRKEDILEFPHYHCCPSNITYKEKPFQEQIPPNLILHQKTFSDTHFKCSKDCPFKSGEESHKKNAAPKPMTKTIGCECTDRNPENKIDVGKNITIQIIPNYSPATCSKQDNTPLENRNNFYNEVSYQQIKCQPYPQFRSSPLAYNDLEHYPRYARRIRPFRWFSCNWCRRRPETPYRRNPNLAETRDCWTTTCQDSYESKAGDCEMVTHCQRVLPISNNYVNRDAILLRSLHQLNRGLLQDIFATPCPSSSSACHKSCLSKLKGPPYQCWAGLNPLCYSAKPPTTNQFCQYDTDCKEKTSTYCSSKDVLYECLKYLKNSGPNENDCEYIDEDCCCCCQSYHNSCCCERRSRCCEKEIFKPKLEEKTSCFTRCRSVEAKQSLKNCGTIVSNTCFNKTETVCTNTEIRIKTPKPEMRRRRICCRRRCCCCNRTRNCCCCCDRCYNSEPTTCYKKIQKTSCCNDEHMIYYCQCEAPPILNNVGSSEIAKSSLQKCIKLGSEMKNTVSKGIDQQSSKEDTIVKFYDKSNTTQKSTSTITTDNSSSQIEDVLIRNLTLHLCDLGEKRFSKFGVSPQHYPWSEKSFFVDMPHEIYRFVGIEKFANPLSEKVHDPTPCLKPEVLHDIEFVKNQLEAKEQNNGEDNEKVFEVKKRCLSTICKAFFDNQQQNEPSINHNILLITKEKSINLIESNYAKVKNEMDNNEKPNKEEPNNPRNDVEEKKTIKETQKCTDIKILSEIKKKNKTHSSNLIKSTSKISQSIPTVPSNICKKSSNISRISSNISKVSSSNSSTNYTPKPFTTKTGLMSFIPSFRESYKTTSTVKKNKNPLTKIDIKSKMSKTQYKSKNEKNKKMKSNIDKLSNEENIEVKSIPQQNEKTTEKIELDNTKETLSKETTILGSNGNYDSTVPLQREEENGADEGTNKQDIKIDHEPFNAKKFNEEINAFYEKCFKISTASTAKNMIPFYNTSVSDVVKSLESRCSIYSPQINSQERNEVKPDIKFPNEDCKNIVFSNKSNSEFYSEVFERSYEQNNMRIPNKIMSKTDLIHLN